jgi:hypothetical protein
VFDQIPTSNQTVVERRLPGSATSLTNALGATNLVFIGRVARVGIPESDSPGFSYYSLDIDVEHVMRGNAGVKFRSGVSVRLFPIDQVESVPTVDSRFIFLPPQQNLWANSGSGRWPS